MPVPMDVILVQAVDDWLQVHPQGKMNGTIPDRPKIKGDIVDQTRLIINAQNALLPKPPASCRFSGMAAGGFLLFENQ